MTDKERIAKLEESVSKLFELLAELSKTTAESLEEQRHLGSAAHHMIAALCKHQNLDSHAMLKEAEEAVEEFDREHKR